MRSSDWPHTPTRVLQHADPGQASPFQAVDAAGLLALLPRWLDDDALVHRVLVDNPARLYGFEQGWLIHRARERGVIACGL